MLDEAENSAASPTRGRGARASTDGKRIFIKSFGCQMNVYDSERMAEAMTGQGYAATTEAETADILVLNTCHIREKAAEKVYSDLGRIRQIKAERARRGKETVVVVAGCVAQAEGAEITRRETAVDLVIGPQSLHRLPELVTRVRSERRPVVETAFPEDDKFAHLPAERSSGSVSAFLTVQEGCDKFCTFCVVPYTRGAEYSRSLAELESEARNLVARGVRELTLLGQNVNAYHGADRGGRPVTLAALIGRLAAIEGLERLRYTTSHPRDMGDDLIACHAQEAKLMPFLHLPVQSGSDRMLAAMNRKHTAEDYRRLVARIRVARPDIALSTDIIVGFPGETEDDFAHTLDLVENVGFAQAFSFKYSPRPGTPAASLPDAVPDAVQRQRLQRLQDLLDGQQRRFNEASVGRVLPVLFEKAGRHPGQLVGRSPYLQLVHATADTSLVGKIVEVDVVGTSQNSLSGVISKP